MFRYHTVHTLSNYLLQEGATDFFKEERMEESLEMMEDTMQLLYGDDDE